MTADVQTPHAPRGRVLITGTSSGIGLACTLHLARMGFGVFAGVRSDEDGRAVERAAREARGTDTSAGWGANVRAIRLDVTDVGSIASAAESIRGEAGGEGLCGLVNNAGISVAGPVEFVPLERWRRQFEVNLFGPVAVTQAMLPLLRQCVAARGKGAARVVMISSISGRVAQPVVAPYSASKFALEAVSDALRLEVKRQGIQVCVVAPGAIDTPIWRKEQQATAGLPAEAWSADLYGGMIEAIKAASRKAARAAIPPQRVADAVAACLTRRRPPIRTWVGWDAKVGAWFRNKIPDRWFDTALARAMGLPTR